MIKYSMGDVVVASTGRHYKVTSVNSEGLILKFILLKKHSRLDIRNIGQEYEPQYDSLIQQNRIYTVLYGKSRQNKHRLTKIFQ